MMIVTLFVNCEGLVRLPLARRARGLDYPWSDMDIDPQVRQNAAALRGHEYAFALVRAGLEYARARHLRVVPIRPTVRIYLKCHPEYLSLVGDKWKGAIERGTE